MAEKNQANKRRIAKALAERTEEVFGAQPSDENIQRIAYEAELYALVDRLPDSERRKADARVAKSAESLREALEQSAKYHETLSVMLGPDCERRLLNVEQVAQGLAKKRKRGRPRNVRLRRLCDVVLDAYWEANEEKLGTQGIHTESVDGTRYGPVLEVVKESLILAGMSVLPPDESIYDAAGDAVKAKVCEM